MYFDESFIQSLPDDPNIALRQICDKYDTMVNDYFQNSGAVHDISVQALDLVSTFLEAIGFELESEIPELFGPRDEDIRRVSDFIAELRDGTTRQLGKGQYDSYKHLFMEKFEVSSHYEFSQGDLDEIQELLNRLRDLFSKSEELEEGHKSRLLRRLEKLQSELHKKVIPLPIVKTENWSF